MGQSLRVEKKWGAKTADERRAERRKQLMRIAVKVYGEEGYRNTSVKAVCAAAGLTERYFYESFANGEDLLLQCFQRITTELLARMRDAARNNGGTPVQRVRAALLVYLKNLQARPAEARVFLIEMASVSPATDALVAASLDEFGTLLMDILRDGRGGERFSPLLLKGVVGGGLHIAKAWIATGYAETVEDVAETALKLYLLMAEH